MKFLLNAGVVTRALACCYWCATRVRGRTGAGGSLLLATAVCPCKRSLEMVGRPATAGLTRVPSDSPAPFPSPPPVPSDGRDALLRRPLQSPELPQFRQVAFHWAGGGRADLSPLQTPGYASSFQGRLGHLDGLTRDLLRGRVLPSPTLGMGRWGGGTILSWKVCNAGR